MPNIEPDFSSTAGSGAAEPMRRVSLPVQLAPHLPAGVETYLGNFQSPAIRAAIAAATQQILQDPHHAKHSRTENGYVLASRLLDLARQIEQVAGGVRAACARTSQTSIQPVQTTPSV